VDGSPESLSTWFSSASWQSHREDVGRRLAEERELDAESFPRSAHWLQTRMSATDALAAASPTAEEQAAKPMAYFVESLGSVEVNPPGGLVLHPHAPLPLQVKNVSETGLCVFALASDDEYVIHTPTPCFLMPGDSLFLHVSCEAAHAPGAELGLVLKPLLPGEEQLGTAEALWHAHPHRIMQKVHVPLTCTALQRTPHPPADGSAPVRSGRRPYSGRTGKLSASEHMLPPASLDAETTASAAATVPASSDNAAEARVQSRLATAATPHERLAAYREQVRLDGEARIVAERVADYPAEAPAASAATATDNSAPF
jgi:hypothetical protein